MTAPTQPPTPHHSAQRCGTCKHWHCRVANLGIGQCRANPPATSFSWPRTRDEDWCNSWTQADTAAAPGVAATVATATEHAQENLSAAKADVSANTGPAFARGTRRTGGPRR